MTTGAGKRGGALRRQSGAATAVLKSANTYASCVGQTGLRLWVRLMRRAAPLRAVSLLARFDANFFSRPRSPMVVQTKKTTSHLALGVTRRHGGVNHRV